MRNRQHIRPGAGAVLWAVTAVLLLDLMQVCPLIAQPLTDQARVGFERVVHGLDPADFGTLKLLDRASLQKVYDDNRKTTAELRQNAKRRTWRQPWEELRDSYLSVAMSMPDTTLAAQAVFRAAECQEEMASWSRSSRDWRRAAALYESMARRHASSVRSDDALYNAARIYAAHLGRTANARECLTWALEKYPRGDMAKPARALLQDLKNGKAVAYAAPAVRDRAEARPGPPVEQSVKPQSSRRTSRAVLRPDGERWLVTIDAGHGGHDPGTMHNGVMEREVTLDVALRLGRLLQAEGLRVHYTRTRDRYVTLANRSAAANSRASDLFVSIHVNAHSNPAIRGCEIYYLDSSPSSSTAVARRENASAGRVTRVSASQAALTSRLLMSRRLAGAVHNSLIGTVRGRGYDMNSMGVRKGPFYVLANAGMPAVLAEIGYCTNKTEATLLRLSDYRQALAEGLAAGILHHCSAATATVTAQR